MAKVDWDSSKYEASAPRNFEAIPKGRYLCVIDAEEMKPTKNKTGSYLEVEFTVLSPKEFKGRKLWARLNVNNPSEVAQRIGREQFNALALSALGTLEIKDTAKLLNKKVVVHAGIERNLEDERVNKVTGFEKFDSTGASASTPDAPSAPKAAPPPPPGGADDDDDIPF